MYRNLFNDTAESETAQKIRMELKLDADNTHAATTGNLDVEGGSINGRRATGSAFTAEAIRIRQERKKQDAALVAIIQNLRDTLNQMQERIDQLNQEIAELSELRDAAETRIETAFKRMHDLESHLEDIGENGFTDKKREALKRAIGQEAEGIDNDEDLLECARRHVDQEQKNGIEAHIEAETINGDILKKIKIRDDLIKARDEIASHPTASLEQKSAMAETALKRSLDEEQVVVEGAGLGTNQAVQKALGEQKTEPVSEDEFDFDEDLPVQPVSVSEPRL